MNIFDTETAVVVFSTFALMTIMYLSFRRSMPYPPGPRPRPLVGNLFDLIATTSELWLQATEWYKQFGDLCHLRMFGQSVLFLNTIESANDLLEKRGAIYSDKPTLIMVGELCGCKEMVPFMKYGESFRKRRRYMQNTIGSRSIPQYYPILESETKTFIESLVSNTDNYLRHIRRYSGGIALAVVYGHKVESSSDDYLLLAEDCMGLLANEIASGSGLWLVDVLPALRYLPAWTPGAEFKRKAVVWKKKMADFVDQPYENSKATWKTGSILPSFCASILDEKQELTPTHEVDIKMSANSMYAASADTTISVISNFILAMLEYPRVLAKAKQEIEEVVGADQLPTFADRSRLPYVEAVLNETWRWGCPVPLNLPHLLQEDDTYMGSFIPKGTLVIANMWAMSRDETLYGSNVSEFRPERFMKPMTPEQKAKMDPRHYVFGFGRRRCPGADLVEASNWLLVAAMVSTLEFSKPIDEHGNPVDPKVVYNNMFFRTPSQFEFNVKYSDRRRKI